MILKKSDDGQKKIHSVYSEHKTNRPFYTMKLETVVSQHVGAEKNQILAL